MSGFNSDIGWRILGLREKFGYSREKFAEIADVNAKYLYEIERGKKNVSACIWDF